MTYRTFADVLLLLNDMMDHARIAESFSRGRTPAELASDLQYRFSVLYALQVVGEVASKVPESVRLKRPAISWSLIVGFRHVVVHGYGKVRLDRVAAILDAEIPGLIREFEELIPEVEALGETPLDARAAT